MTYSLFVSFVLSDSSNLLNSFSTRWSSSSLTSTTSSTCRTWRCMKCLSYERIHLTLSPPSRDGQHNNFSIVPSPISVMPLPHKLLHKAGSSENPPKPGSQKEHPAIELVSLWNVDFWVVWKYFLVQEQKQFLVQEEQANHQIQHPNV